MSDSRQPPMDDTQMVDGAIHLSVVIPACNEAERIPLFLYEVDRYLTSAYGSSAEVIIVVDGSEDELARVVRDVAPRSRLVRHPHNLGKGAAVRTGMKLSRGALVLVADADGATPIGEESDLRRAIDDGADIAVGSRRLVSEKHCQRRARRQVLGWLAHGVVRVLANCGVSDTQCGFKMFRGQVAHRLAERTTFDGFAIDVELLRVARSMGYRIVEVPVAWREVPGSKLHLASAGARFLVDLVRLRFTSWQRFGHASSEIDHACLNSSSHGRSAGFVQIFEKSGS